MLLADPRVALNEVKSLFVGANSRGKRGVIFDYHRATLVKAEGKVRKIKWQVIVEER